VRASRALRVGRVSIDPATPQVTRSNMTIINWALHVCGPMREDRLTLALLGLQVLAPTLSLTLTLTSPSRCSACRC
jgi:hypothetical protein